MSSVDAPFRYLVKMFESGDAGETLTTNSQPQAAEVSLHERLFQQLNELYYHPSNGLITIGDKVDVEILPPKKKVTILLIGNHSAGKSSFINWYIEDNVQNTGMAIETQSFSVVASGKKRETLMGPATVFLFPHLKPLERMEGVIDYVTAEISTSKKRQFSMITFIDTPGLVDGGLEYPYSVNDAILFLGGVADLIFVFFDPIGLALCKRTMMVVERINTLYPEKLHFYLSKSDEIRKQTDKQKIMMQITQEVCRHSGLNRSGFSMPGIYIPTLARNPVQKQASTPAGSEKTGTCQTGECLNEIEEVCNQIDQSIRRTLQIALNNFDRDINSVLESINRKLATNKLISERNWTCFMFSSVAVIIVVALLFSTGLKYLIEQYGLDVLSSTLHVPSDVLQPLTVPVKMMLSLSAIENQNHLYLGYFIIFITVVLYICHCKMRLTPTLPRRDVRELERLQVFTSSYLMKKKVQLTQEYLGDSYDL